MRNSVRAEWDAIILRPIMLGWNVEEQITNSRTSTTTFVKMGRIHHRAEPSKIYISFLEFNKRATPSEPRFRVKAGRNVQPCEGLHAFNDIKSATDYITYLADSTDRWLEKVNSEDTIAAYEKRFPLEQ